MAVRGIDSLRSPFERSPRRLVVLRQLAAQLSNVGFSSPVGDTLIAKQKARTSVQALNLNIWREGIPKTPIRYRIHFRGDAPSALGHLTKLSLQHCLERALM